MSVTVQHMKHAENQVKASLSLALNSAVLLTVVLLLVLAFGVLTALRQP